MLMTPIKVRGKRSSVQRDSSEHSLHSHSPLNPYPRNKRPISPASAFSTPAAKLPRRTNTCGENGPRHARFAAPLEQLPTELLETIFLHHLNISLPQASPIIGKKLASKHVKTQLVLRVCSATTLKIYPSEQAALFPAVTDHAEAQSAILRMKWMTLPFLRQLIPEYITKTLLRELSERRLQWLGKGPLVTEETESTIRQYLEETSLRLTKGNLDDPPMFAYVRWRIENPPRFIRLSFSLHDGVVTIEERHIDGLEDCGQHVRLWSAEPYQWRIFCGINGCRVPEKLLHEPWTTDKCDFLEMLLRGNATVDWVDSISGETAEKGLMQALRQGNTRATRLLVTRAGPGNPQGLWGSPYSPTGSDYQELDPGSGPPVGLFQAYAFGLRGVGVVPQTKHLRSAVLETGCRQEIVRILLMAEDTNIDFEDPAILEWAVGKRSQGDERGPWLLSMLDSCRIRCR